MKNKFWFLVIIVMVLVSSVFLLRWTWQILLAQRNDEILRQAIAISEGLDPAVLDGLPGDMEESGSPEFLVVKTQLKSVQPLYPNVNRLYLLKQDENGQVFYIFDSGTRGSEEYDLQGEIFTDTSVDIQNLITKGTEIIEGPFEIDGGEWIRVLIPLSSPAYDKVSTIFGMDIDASDFVGGITLDFYLPLGAVILLNVSIWCFFIFQQYWQKNRERPKVEVLARYYMILFTGIIGICTTIVSTWFVGYFEDESRQAIFSQLSSEKVINLFTELQDIDRFSLEGLKEFYLGSDFVSREEFYQYSQALVDNELVSTWAWAPEIDRDERLAFERTLQEDISSAGKVWEYSIEGGTKSAEIRESHYPIEYVAPENENNLSLIGFDLASCGNEQHLNIEAMPTDPIFASDSFTLICGEESENVIVVMPVLHSEARDHQDGFVVAMIQTEKITHVIQTSDGVNETTIYMDFFRLAPDGTINLLGSNSPEVIQQEHLQSNLTAHLKVEFTSVQPLFIYGNTYVIITHPSPVFSRLYPANSTIILAVSGGLMTIALMVFVNHLSGRNIILTRLVNERTKKLSASEERLRLASNSVRLGVYDINTRTKVVFVNDVYAEMLGYNPDTFTETYKSWLSRLHPEDKKDARKAFDGFMEGKEPEYKIEFRLRTAYKDWIWVLSKAMIVEWDEDGRPIRILGSHLDITERKKASLRIAQLLDESNLRLRRMETLREIDKAITSEYDLDKILNTFLSQVKDQLQIDAVSIFLFDEEAEIYRYVKGVGLHEEKYQGLNLKHHNSLAGKVTDYGRPIHTQSFEEFVAPSLLPRLADEGFKDCFAFSLISQGKVKGVMELWHRSLKVPTSEWMNFAEILAGQVAIAVEHVQLFSGLRKANEDLRQAYNATIEGWSKAMDLKDEETAGHTQRVTQMTVNLAKRLGIGGEKLEHIRRGALLHDIGKMGVPDSILLKPGPFTHEERMVMENHPKYAFEMLKSIDYLVPALDIPYLHHESWDGTGYPLGLKGREIPLAARLFAIIDVFDALTNDRPYRSAWSTEETLQYLEQNKGVKFDPDLVEEFIAMIRENQ